MLGTAASPAAPAGDAQALFAEARRRRHRRWAAGLAATLVLAVLAATGVIAWAGGAPPDNRDSGRGSGAAPVSLVRATVAWVDYRGRLHFGQIRAGSRLRLAQRVVARVAAYPALPLTPAGDRLYWVDENANPAVVQYLDLATGRVQDAGQGQWVFASADGQRVYIPATSTTLTSEPASSRGRVRQLTVPRGWHLPDRFGTAVAGGVTVVSNAGRRSGAQVLGVWNLATGRVRSIGRVFVIIGSYTAPGARDGLLAWDTAGCPSSPRCAIKITNTATLATRTVRSPLHHGFAFGGAFSPDGTQLAVFPNNAPWMGTPRAAGIALARTATGRLRMAARPTLGLGSDVTWAQWLPGGTRLIVGGIDRSYLVDPASLAARPLYFLRGTDHYIEDSQDINYTAAVIPPSR